MALVLKDRVKEQTTTTGTGTITLGGAVSGFEAFSAVGDGNTTYYAIVHQTADEWEVGLGTYTAAGTLLSRDTILESSNSDAAVNFSAGTKDVFVTYPSDKAVYADAAGEVSVTRATSATFATSATEAATAIFATSATNATFAVSATRATSATFAASATFATSATNATTAVSATNATSATFATSATNATTAINVDGGTVSATDGTFNTMTVVTSASVGGTFNVGGNLTVDTNTLFVDAANNRVGIGTSSPASRLTVSDGSSGLTPFSGTDVFMDSNGSNYFQFGSGSSSSAAIYFGDSADGDAGGIIYSHATDAMSFRVNAAEHMRIDSSGNVGIGTASPSQKLTIQGTDARIYLTGANTDIDMTGSADGQLSLDGNGYAFGIALNSSGANLYTNSASRDVIFGVNETEIMRITDSNVGIGTSSPSSAINGSLKALEISSAVGSAIRATDTAASTNIEIAAGIGSTYVWNTTNTPMKFGTNNAERMQIDSSGNVGIGTTAQAEKLEVNGAIVALGAASSYTNTGLYLQNKGSSVFDVGAWRSGASVAELTFSTDSGSDVAPVERMRIDSSGNVGIGTTSPSYLTHLYSTSAEPKLVIEDASSGAGRGGIVTGTWGGNGIRLDSLGAAGWVYVGGGNTSFIPFTIGTEKARFHSNGNFGIGTTSPSYPLHVSPGTSGEVARFNSTATVGATTDVVTFSDTNNFGLTLEGRSGGAAFKMNGTQTLALGQVSNGDAITINGSGNVGIGTSSPAKQFEITKSARATITSLTDGATITPDFDAAQNFAVTLGGNRTLANPSNIDPGQTGSIFVVQDVTGGRTLSFGSYWKFAGGTAPTLSTGTSATDRIDYVVQTSTAIHAVASLNLS